MIHLQIIDP